MKILIPAAVTYSRYSKLNKYYWRSEPKTSEHKKIEKRLALRISTGQFGKKASKLESAERQVTITFVKDKEWILILKRVKKGITLSTFVKNPEHIWLQIILNRLAPQKFLSELSLEKAFGAITVPVKIQIDLQQWKDIDLQPWDFLYHTELHAKTLMEYALSQKFQVNYVPKGREFDLQLVSPKNRKFAIAISSHIAGSESRSKQHRIQKSLMDIAKMLPTLHCDKDLIPVIVSQPTEFNGSWNFTSSNYLKFYQEKFNFKFISTNFKSGWEKEVCKELERI